MPRAYRVRTLPEASQDLTEIFKYIKEDSPDNAAAMIGRLFDAIDSLNHFPNRHRVHRSFKDPARVVRAMPVPPYIIYYRVIESDQLVEVMTVRHGARRQPRKFK
jgi:toxin ParE1/3/4